MNNTIYQKIAGPMPMIPQKVAIVNTHDIQFQASDNKSDYQSAGRSDGITVPHLAGSMACQSRKNSKVLPTNINVGLPIKKRIFDICFSLIIMVLGAPVFLLILLITSFSSRGPVFFRQERLGKNRRKFFMYKFRSMYCDAESGGPQLSRADDPRITKWGRLIRRTRLDELPQFWNVLKGDMSIVGPRPERACYVEKIIIHRPDYLSLQYITPGITSLGQVNYGYAENVEQMCARLDIDLIYLTDMSFRADLNIIAKTIVVMVSGRGK